MNPIGKLVLALAMSSAMAMPAKDAATAAPKVDPKADPKAKTDANPELIIAQFLQSFSSNNTDKALKDGEDAAYKLIQDFSKNNAVANETVATIIKTLDPQATAANIKNGQDFVYSALKTINATSSQTGLQNIPVGIALSAVEDKENQKRIADTTAFFTNFFVPLFSQASQMNAKNPKDAKAAPLAKNSGQGLFPTNKETEATNADFLTMLSNQVKAFTGMGKAEKQAKH